MRTALLVTVLITFCALASGEVLLEHTLYVPGSDAQLSYDDGSANWLTWNGVYRGVWFNTADFGYGDPWDADNTEFWFYHHSSYQWDTPCFYAELWNGNNISGPVTQLDQTSVTATHYAAVYANYSASITCESQFWVISSTEMSSGGWPSILSDPTPGIHSFQSDDFIEWDSWNLGDYFIRTNSEGLRLDSQTWGAIKTLFSE